MKQIVITTPEMRTVFKTGDLYGAIFTKKVEVAYEKVFYWKRSLFLLPTGNASRNYINEMMRLLTTGLTRMQSKI